MLMFGDVMPQEAAEFVTAHSRYQSVFEPGGELGQTAASLITFTYLYKYI